MFILPLCQRAFLSGNVFTARTDRTWRTSLLLPSGLSYFYRVLLDLSMLYQQNRFTSHPLSPASGGGEGAVKKEKPRFHTRIFL